MRLIIHLKLLTVYSNKIIFFISTIIRLSNLIFSSNSACSLLPQTPLQYRINGWVAGPRNWVSIYCIDYIHYTVYSGLLQTQGHPWVQILTSKRARSALGPQGGGRKGVMVLYCKCSILQTVILRFQIIVLISFLRILYRFKLKCRSCLVVL